MKIFLLFFFLLSCTQVYQIGLKEHSFSSQPRKIVWIQVAGFDVNHLGILKFTEWVESKGLGYRTFTCLGQVWDYNLFKLRPEYYESMHAQVTGKNNAQKNCDDFSERPYWNYLSREKGFDVYLIEQGLGKNIELLANNKCTNKAQWLENVVYIDRKIKGFDQSNKYQKFHFSDIKQLEKGKFYKDRSCQKSGCFSSLSQVFTSLYSRNLKNESKFVINVRDFSYQYYLQKGLYKKAAEFLQDLEKTLSYMRKNYSESELLFVVTGVSGRPLRYPQNGKEWKNLEKSKKRVLSQVSSLTSPVFAYGARSENFCGIYQQSELFQRIFYDKKRIKVGL